MAVDPFALASLAEVKSHLNIIVASQDTKLERMINSASTRIENYIDRLVLSRSYTEYQDGRGNDRLLLSQWPATKPTEVWDDPSGLFTDATNQFDTSEYELEEDVGIILLGGERFTRATRNIKIVYEAGYATVPYDINEACLLTVEFMYDMASDRRIGTSSKSKNGESTTFVQGLPESVKEILDPYMRIDFGNVPAPVENY